MKKMQALGRNITITDAHTPRDALPKSGRKSGLSLIFPAGQRPSVADILRLTESSEGHASRFAVTYQLESAGRLELLADGQTFDLAGLTPAAPAATPEVGHCFGFATRPVLDSCEAITLVPGAELRGAENLLPVVRMMAGIALGLARLAGVIAIVWHPARTALAPAAFVAAIADWLQGGAFPALGLTALYRDDDGALCTEGLAFFTGQELRVEPESSEPAQDAKLAVRVIHDLVGKSPVDETLDIIGPYGEKISVAPLGNPRVLTVWRKT